MKKYILQLFIFGIISQIPYYLFFGTKELNIYFTLLFGVFCMYTWDKVNNKFLKIIIIGLLIGFAGILHFDTGWYGVLSIFIFHVFKDNKKLMTLFYILITFLNYLPSFIISNFYYPNILLFLYSLVPLLPILLFNGEKGKDTKYLFYFFYPIHFVILYLIRIYL